MHPATAALRPFDAEQALRLARETFNLEAAALQQMAVRLDARFAEAVQAVLQIRGRVVVMGMGKSGHVGRKIAATLASTGTPALFVHPAEASHGDLGMVTAQDLVLAISNSGESAEFSAIVPVLKRLGAPLIALTGPCRSGAGLQCRARSLPAQPGAHHQHHRANGNGRRAGGGTAGRARLSC